MPASHNKRPPQSTGGFALVIALSLMAFVLLLLLSITTLVQVESQSAAMASARVEAEQAALLGLNVAIGELQKTAGPDQRITATADRIVDANGVAAGHQYYTGVWNSTDGTFIKWLATAADANGELDPNGLINELDVNTASVAPESVVLHKAFDGTQDVAVDKVSFEPTTAYAYWIADEGVKAKVNTIADEEYYTAVAEADPQDPEWLYPMGAAQSVGSELITEINAVTAGKHSDAAIRAYLRKSQSTDDFELRGVAAADVRKLDHDVTHFSYGLLTNPVDGGLKTDLSLAFEHGNADAGNVFVVEDYSHPDAGAIDVRGPSWSVFQDHYNLYKQMSFSSGVPRINTTDPMAHGSLTGGDASNFYIFRGELGGRYMDPNVYEVAESIGYGPDGFVLPRPLFVQRQPVYLGHIMVISMFIDEELVGAETVDILKTVLNPVAILWNPYNVELELSGQSRVKIQPNIAVEYRFNGDTEPYKGRASVPIMLQEQIGARRPDLYLTIPSGDRFEPGELKLYSANGAVTSSFVSTTTTFNPTSGVYLDRWLDAPLIGANDITTMSDTANYVANGLTVPAGVTSIDIAISPYQTNYNESYYELNDNSRFAYNKLTAFTGDMGTGPTGAQGTFDVTSSGKEGLSFVTSLPVSSLTSPYPVGIFNWTIAAAGDKNNHLYNADVNKRSAIDMFLMSNPRAPFSTSEVGTYWHQRSNVYTTLEPLAFGGGFTALDNFFLGYERPHYGTSYNSDGNGQNRPVAWEFPLTPLTSIAQLQHVFFNVDGYEPSYAVGNSFASPYLRRGESISTVGPIQYLNNGTTWTGSAVDFSYLLNEALWDDYFFSSISPTYVGGSETEDLDDAINAFVDGASTLKNARMRVHLPTGTDVDALTTILQDGDLDRTPEETLAAHLLVEGAFNVNSTSIAAWRAFLGSAYNQAVVGMELNDGAGQSLKIETNSAAAAFSRFTLPTLDKSHPSGSTIQNNQGSGYRTLDAFELNDLATQVVEQVKLRGPFVSLSDFINRKLSDGEDGLMGALQQAINDAELNDDFALGLSVDYSGSSPSSTKRHDVFLDPEAGTGNSYGVGPGYLLQGDILNSLGPYLTVKSNTFTIRSYGESSNPVTGARSEVYLEATVQQVPEFVDRIDSADTELADLNVTNERFGRKFKIISIRHLDPNEI